MVTVTGYWLLAMPRLYWPGLTGHQSNQQVAVGTTLGSSAQASGNTRVHGSLPLVIPSSHPPRKGGYRNAGMTSGRRRALPILGRGKPRSGL